MSELQAPDYFNPKYRNPEPPPKKDERFEEWWREKMGTRMIGSKYLARAAWLAALWAYGVKTKEVKGA